MVFPVPARLRHVIVFAPYIEQHGELVSPHYDLLEYREEIGGWMQALGLTWEWRPVLARTLAQTFERVRLGCADGATIVFNLCDGSGSDGYPGIEVVEALEAERIPYTGSDAAFYRVTTAKSLGKKAFAAHGVQSAPWAAIENAERDLPAAAARIGFPLFVKPDVSAGSYGIQIDSVCYDLASARRKVEQLQHGLHGQHFDGGVIAEQFVEGREFTVLLVEDAAEPMGLWVLHPGERVFDKRVPPRERFLAFERYWGLPEAERPIPPGEPYYWYDKAPAELTAQLEDLARRAFRAVGGAGYARVDIRLDERSGLLNVLEVNAQCGLSSDDSSTVGSMLRLSGQTIIGVIARILAHALQRRRSD